ncbi:MAG TPA: DUF1294 domain-containing protein [Mobilitalea sp.]|nr:DUF1294 domain-containing protein [Mobilitalea sp.]
MEQIGFWLALGYFAAMSIAGFASMGIDKYKAIKKTWRIPERTLISIALLGGGIGSLLGMLFYHHKTKHIKFTILLPITAVLDIFAILIILEVLK